MTLKSLLALAMTGGLLLAPLPTLAVCDPGAYGNGSGDFVVLRPLSAPTPGTRYLFRDGRRGRTDDQNSPVTCHDGAVTIQSPGRVATGWKKIELAEKETTFTSNGTDLVGKLIEPAGNDPGRPLVVMVHGSERTPALGSIYAYALAAQGIAVFAYDKRGTGGSQGEYTQNFELLADDAAAALVHARNLAAGRFGRAGYYGGSQGGWVAPLAATRSPADFVAVGFGLVASPIEEDHQQMLLEAQAAGLGDRERKLIDRLSEATAKLLTSNFTSGHEELANVRRALANEAWAARIKGEHSGDMLRMSEADLRRVGRARFDNLELIWDYDAITPLKKVDVPLLWVLAGADQEAPIEQTQKKLSALIPDGRPIDLYLFPDTDHGMWEFTTNADGSREVTRITDGYLRLLGDWMKRETQGPYGRGQRLNAVGPDTGKGSR